MSAIIEAVYFAYTLTYTLCMQRFRVHCQNGLYRNKRYICQLRVSMCRWQTENDIGRKWRCFLPGDGKKLSIKDAFYVVLFTPTSKEELFVLLNKKSTFSLE